MKSLEELLLYGTGISELPPSFGNLTGMIRLPQSARSAQTSEIFVQIREMIRLPPNLPPCHMLIVPHPNSGSTISPAFVPGYDSFPVYQPQSSLQKLFEDLNLGDRNLVQIFCETFADDGEIAPAITRVGVHVECICSPQKPRGSQISKSIVQRNRRRPALLHGSSFIMRKQYNTKRSTRIKENETLLIKFQQKHWKVGTPWRTIDDEQDSSIEDEVIKGNSHGLVARLGMKWSKLFNGTLSGLSWDEIGEMVTAEIMWILIPRCILMLGLIETNMFQVVTNCCCIC
ncbi:hypothetical protein CMV_030357 [Castanea mollissima]|uniref:Uncharacterized protein n=1 Tax=Castanea mollissima TaxID=60419 RepID=A0A8J4VCG1_9ROSI|nr:hypothetical protein CMV_030357 [Castanea mollissima]